MAESTDCRHHLQDDLRRPIHLLDEGGELTDSYGYDEFGQDLYGNQGIVQSFGYTGYQADRIAGTYFAQMREYKPELGRFAGQDIIKGFVIAPYTLNEYGYCWGNPLIFLDLDGAWPGWQYDLLKVTAAAITVATFGTGAGIVVAAVGAIGGVAGGISAMQSGGNTADGIVQGGTVTTTATVATIANPVGAGLGAGGQVATDLIKGEASSPESYAGAMFGGAVGVNTGSAMIGAAVATSAGEILENANGVYEHDTMEILRDTAATGAIAGGTHFVVSNANLYLGMGLNDCESNRTESIVSGAANGVYYNFIDSKKENLEQGKD